MNLYLEKVTEVYKRRIPNIHNNQDHPRKLTKLGHSVHNSCNNK